MSSTIKTKISRKNLERYSKINLKNSFVIKQKSFENMEDAIVNFFQEFSKINFPFNYKFRDDFIIKLKKMTLKERVTILLIITKLIDDEGYLINCQLPFLHLFPYKDFHLDKINDPECFSNKNEIIDFIKDCSKPEEIFILLSSIEKMTSNIKYVKVPRTNKVDKVTIFAPNNYKMSDYAYKELINKAKRSPISVNLFVGQDLSGYYYEYNFKKNNGGVNRPEIKTHLIILCEGNEQNEYLHEYGHALFYHTSFSIDSWRHIFAKNKIKFSDIKNFFSHFLIKYNAKKDIIKEELINKRFVFQKEKHEDVPKTKYSFLNIRIKGRFFALKVRRMPNMKVLEIIDDSNYHKGVDDFAGHPSNNKNYDMDLCETFASSYGAINGYLVKFMGFLFDPKTTSKQKNLGFSILEFFLGQNFLIKEYYDLKSINLIVSESLKYMEKYPKHRNILTLLINKLTT